MDIEKVELCVDPSRGQLVFEGYRVPSREELKKVESDHLAAVTAYASLLSKYQAEMVQY